MKTLITWLLVMNFFVVFGQANEELDKRNGFKDIKLLSKIDQYDNLEIDKQLDPEHFIGQYKRTRSSYPSIGEIEVKDLTLLTYKGIVYQINIVTAKNPQLYKGLVKAFGKAQHSVRYQKYFWEGKNVKLTFESIASNKLQLIYYAKGIKKIMKSDKIKKIEQLATEF